MLNSFKPVLIKEKDVLKNKICKIFYYDLDLYEQAACYRTESINEIQFIIQIRINNKIFINELIENISEHNDLINFCHNIINDRYLSGYIVNLQYKRFEDCLLLYLKDDVLIIDMEIVYEHRK